MALNDNVEEIEIDEAFGKKRTVMFPVKHPDIWKMYLDAKSTLLGWQIESVSFDADLVQWPTIPEDERRLLLLVHAFFAVGDGVVSEVACNFFYRRIKDSEIRAMLATILYNETVHAESYNTVIDIFVKNPEEKAKLLNFPSAAIDKKVAWMTKWNAWENAGEIDEASRFPLKRAFVAQVCSEGLFFQASFAIIFWFKKKGLVPGLIVLNEYIARDENGHCTLFVKLYNDFVRHKLPVEYMYSIFSEAVQTEDAFIDELMVVDFPGLTAKLLKQYVRFVANYWLRNLHIPPLYPNITNPFGWMDLISLEGKSNMQDRHVTEYNKKLDFGKNPASITTAEGVLDVRLVLNEDPNDF